MLFCKKIVVRMLSHFSFFAILCSLHAPSLLCGEQTALLEDLEQRLICLTESKEDIEDVESRIKAQIALLCEAGKQRMLDHLDDNFLFSVDTIPLLETIEIMELSASDVLHFRYPLRLVLSEIAHMYLEILMYETTLKNVSIRGDILTRMGECLGKAKQGLPRTQMKAHFHLDCCTSILKYFTTNPNKEFKGALYHIYNGSVEGLFKMIPSTYKKMIPSWYISIWPMRWLALKVTDLDSFSLYLKKDIERIRETRINRNYIIGSMFILADLIERIDVNDLLKEKILYNYFFSMIVHKHTEVRYLVATYLRKWAEDSNYAAYRENIHRLFSKCREGERDAQVKRLLTF